MATSESQRAKVLATRWGLNVPHALYRKTGTWYHRLNAFPGALLDADGYVLFENQRAFESCPQLQIGKQVGAPKGIKAIPDYVYVSTAADQPDRAMVESLVRTRSLAPGQGWRGSPESRKSIEAYAMGLAVRHYSASWPDVVDVSANQPFDLLCRDGHRELRVEVKGTTSRGLSVLLTRNEVRHAQANADKVALFVVSEINSPSAGSCTGGVTQVFEPWDIRHSELDPVAFECWPTKRHNERLQPTARVSSSERSNVRARRG